VDYEEENSEEEYEEVKEDESLEDDSSMDDDIDSILLNSKNYISCKCNNSHI
jgi:hypothetical protein